MNQFSMEDLRQMTVDWQEAAMASVLGDAERVKGLLVPSMGYWVNYGAMMTIAMLGATLTASAMRERAGVPSDADCVIGATDLSPHIEQSAAQRLALNMLLAAGNRDYPTLEKALRTFCPPDQAGLDNLVAVQLELLALYRMVIECP